MFKALRVMVWLVFVLTVVVLSGCGGGGGSGGGSGGDTPPETIPPVTTASPPGGDYTNPLMVTLSTNEPATIYYTLNGNDPAIGRPGTLSGQSPITSILIQPGQTTIKFFAIDIAGNREAVKTAVYAVAGASGTWIGHYQSELFASTPMRIDLTQVGSTVTGTYADTNGVSGSFDATVSGYDFTFTVTSTTGPCPGSFDGTGTISGDTFSFTFNGNDCLGTHQNGTGSVTRQAGSVLAFGLQTPTHLTLQAGSLYWSESGEAALKRMPATGGEPMTLARKLGVPHGLLYADSALYWTDSGTTAGSKTCGTGVGRRWQILNRSSLDGSLTQRLTEGCSIEPDVPRNLVSDGQNLYWHLSTPSPNTYILQMVPLDGSSPSDLVTSTVPIEALFRESGYLYWREQAFPDAGRLMRMPLGGGNATVVYDAGGTGNPLVGPMASNGTDLFFVYGPFTTLPLARVPVAGGSATTLATLSQTPLALAVDNQYIYGVDSESFYRIPLTGGTPVILSTASAMVTRAVIDLLLDEVVWLDSNGELFSVPISGGTPVQRAAGLFHPASLAVGPDAIYVTEGDGSGYGEIESFGQITAYDRASDSVVPFITGIFEANVPLAVVGDNLYIADGWRIKQIPAGGGAPALVWQTGSDEIKDIATDGSAIYWLEGKGIFTIRRRPVAGIGPAETLATSNNYVERLTTDGTNVYWLEGLDTLKKVPVTGSPVTTLVTGTVAISGFFSDGNYLYYAEQDTGYIKRVPIAGGAPEMLTTMARSSSRVALTGDDTQIFWLDLSYLGKLPKEGGLANRIFDSGLFSSPAIMDSLAVDSARIYWNETAGGTIKSWPK